jgi:hypothetical protein
MKYSETEILKHTDAILDLYGNTVFGITGSKNRPATQPLFMGLIKCFDDRRSVRLWLMIPVVSMNKNPEIKTHAYMQAVRNKMAID